LELGEPACDSTAYTLRGAGTGAVWDVIDCTADVDAGTDHDLAKCEGVGVVRSEIQNRTSYGLPYLIVGFGYSYRL